MLHRSLFVTLGALGLIGARPVAAPTRRAPTGGTVVYAVGREPTMPVPVLSQNEAANEAVADQLFLHLATFAPGGRVSGDDALLPSLARRWHRIDSVTMVFEIDPRAKWQDGAPVTAHDVVYTWQLAMNPAVGRDQSRLASIAAVEATGDRTVRVRFTQPSAEQVYTFAFLIQPLPSHLLERMPAESIATSDFVSHPVGDGPYQFVRRVPGQFVELHADTTFFLGRPGIGRLLFRYVEDASARVNLFLTGETDILDNIPPPALAQVRALPTARIVDVASNDLVSFLFNTRSPNDTARVNPLFADARVREALALALDPGLIARTIFDPSAYAPLAAQSEVWNWITPGQNVSAAQNVPRARALLLQAGWRDTNGDGVLDKGGVPLHFALLYPSSSAMRHTAAVEAQQMWRAIGVDVTLDRVEGPVFGARLPTGAWDVIINRVGEDPTPSSLVQSWSCEAAHEAGSTNFAHWCDPAFDHLVQQAVTARNQPAAWRAVMARMAAERPAIFMAAAHTPIAVQQRLEHVIIWPTHPWLSIWQWQVRAGEALPRDR